MRSDWLTRVLWLGTGLALVIVAWLLWGAGLFRLGGRYPGLDSLEHVGSFVGGVFTPIAVGWAARTFLLQRQQMIDTLNEMRLQNNLQREALGHAKEQFLIDRKAELEKGDPKFQFVQDGQMSNGQASTFKFKIRNLGAAAQRVSISYAIRDSATNAEIYAQPPRDLQPLSADGTTSYSIAFVGAERSTLTTGVTLKAGYIGEFTILAQRLDGNVSRYTFTSQNLVDVRLVKTESAVQGLNMP